MGELVIYRYDDGVLGKIYRKVKKAPPISGKGINTAISSVEALKLATELAVKQAQMLVAVVGAASVAKFIYEINCDNVFVLSTEEINKYKNAHGNRWVEKTQYYIGHPKTEYSNFLIEADQFVHYIEQEKIEEIIAFILQNCKPQNSITIKKSSIKGINVNLSGKGSFMTGTNKIGKTQNINADMGGHLNNEEGLVIVTRIDCKKINQKKLNEYKLKKLVWINDEFKNLRAAVISNAFTIEENIKNNWGTGLDADLAKIIKFDFDANSDSGYSLLIEVK